jgi:hypothetical protein
MIQNKTFSNNKAADAVEKVQMPFLGSSVEVQSCKKLKILNLYKMKVSTLFNA